MKEESLEYLPYGRHQIIDSDVEKVVDLLKNHNLTQGKILENFEEAISSKVSSKFCIAVNSATSALHLSCMAIGLKKNDILWTTPNSFVASANCVAYVGAEIDFVDVDGHDFCTPRATTEQNTQQSRISDARGAFVMQTMIDEFGNFVHV